MIRVDFVAGTEWDARFPRFVAMAGLTHRLAVIQDSYVEGAGEMVFDEALWRTLVDFIASQNGQTFIAENIAKVGRREVQLTEYMAKWERLSPDERSPPGWIGLRADGKLKLCIIREYWNQVGGPQPYSDSYTYSVMSGRDLTMEVVTWLRDSPAATGWKLGEIQQADDTPRPWWQWVWAWLRSWW